VATTLLLARHGETDSNRERRWRDLDRARETADLVAAELGLTARPDPRLREVDVGDLAGRAVADLPGDWARPIDYLLARRRHLFDEMRSRVVAALLEIAAAHEDGRVLVVTHGGPIAAAWFACGGSAAERPSVGNCHVLPIRIENGVIAPID
jgi:2,3-bisphosphoglycerate-dependent phosphoglycerate mutase